jgi:bifunctional ADP-heptose synthase (sugar kinase/adenylyltransferase)
MEALLDRCLQKRLPTVLVVGDIICDIYLWGAVSRISPEAPVPVFESMERRQTLGELPMWRRICGHWDVRYACWA